MNFRFFVFTWMPSGTQAQRSTVSKNSGFGPQAPIAVLRAATDPMQGEGLFTSGGEASVGEVDVHPVASRAEGSQEQSSE